jgi:putative Mg2+ transporter-C (MgtC) family protein
MPRAFHRLAQVTRYMDSISVPGDTLALAVRLGLATVLGGAVGLNREIFLKPAGLRTHALVSLGAALATYIGLQLTQYTAGDPTAPSRVIQGIIAGVGFIGGGVILHRQGGRMVHGLTTASSIWVVAATGVAAGAGLWRAAVLSVVLSLIVLTVGLPIDQALHRISRGDPADD